MRTSLRRDGFDAPPCGGGGGGPPEAASGEGDRGRRLSGATGGDADGPRGAPHAGQRHRRGPLCLVAASLLRRIRGKAGWGGSTGEGKRWGFYRGYRREEQNRGDRRRAADWMESQQGMW
jgi:hypothetical protein